MQKRTLLVDHSSGRKAALRGRVVACVVRDATLGLAVPRLRYVVTFGGGRPRQAGLTDAGGRFPLLLEDGGDPRVSFFDAEGRTVAEAGLKASADLEIVTVPFEVWRARRKSPAESPAGGFYRRLVEELETRASRQRLAVGRAADRCLRAASELDALTSLAERAARQEPAALERLAALSNKRRSAATLDRARPGGEAGAEGRAIQKHAEDAPPFGPGLDRLYRLALELAPAHPSVARALTGAMFDLNRALMPVVRAFRRGGREGAGPGFDIPLELTDPYAPDDGFGGGFDGGRPGEPDLRPGAGHWTDEDRARARCEVTLIDAVDEHGRRPQGSGGAGGAFVAASIVSIAPDHEPQQGNRTIAITVASRSAELVTGATSAPVSFPTTNGRVEVLATVVSSQQQDDGAWSHVLHVTAPFHTRPGLLQVLGMPSECRGGEVASDPALDDLLTHIDACLGTSHGSASTPFGPGNHCEPTEPNWQGGTPDVRFRWQDGSDLVDGDEWMAAGCVTTHVPADSDLRPPAQGSASTGPRGDRVARPEWVQVSILDKIEAEGCHLDRHSVPMPIEADRTVHVEISATNGPVGRLSLQASPPIQGGITSAAGHRIGDTLYHVAWADEALVPRTAWTELGQVSASALPASVSFNVAALGRIAEASIQVIRASVSNELPGFGQRGLEIVRFLRPARIENLHVLTPFQPRDVASDPRVGPEERIEIAFDVGMPTFAETGVRGTAKVAFNGQTVEEISFRAWSRQAVSLRTGAIELSQRAEEGQVEVRVTVTYAYTSDADYPEGVALGEREGQAALLRFVVLPRVVLMTFAGQWDDVFDGSGGIVGSNCAVDLCRRVERGLRELDAQGNTVQNVVFRSFVTGRDGQTNWNLAHSSLGEWGDALAGVADTTLTEWTRQRGTLTQIPDPSVAASPISRGCVHMFASEWGFEEGNNEWGEIQRSWTNPENDAQVDFYMRQSGMAAALRGIMSGPRKTYFFLAGHSRGGGSAFNIMSWLKRSAPADWQVVAAVFFDAMHTDGFFQPVTSFPVCAEEMLHFYATQTGAVSNTNCPWDGEHHQTGASASCHGVPPDCPGSVFNQVAVDASHGEVPYVTNGTPPVRFVLNRARDVMVKKCAS